MHMISRILVMGAFAAAFVTQALAQSPRDEIEAALVKFEDAFNKGDAGAVAALYAEDAAILPPDSPRVDGRAGIEAYWKGAITAGVTDLDLKALEVAAGGDHAFEVGEASFSVPGTDGAKMTAAVKYLVIWKKGADGSWQLYRDIWNDKAPAK